MNTAAHKEQLAKLLASLESYKDLKPGWDGYNGELPSLSAITEVAGFLRGMQGDLLPDRTGVAGDGEVSLIWEHKGFFADFGFYGDGLFALHYTSDQCQGFGAEVALEKGVPQDMRDYLLVDFSARLAG